MGWLWSGLKERQHGCSCGAGLGRGGHVAHILQGSTDLTPLGLWQLRVIFSSNGVIVIDEMRSEE